MKDKKPVIDESICLGCGMSKARCQRIVAEGPCNIFDAPSAGKIFFAQLKEQVPVLRQEREVFAACLQGISKALLQGRHKVGRGRFG